MKTKTLHGVFVIFGELLGGVEGGGDKKLWGEALHWRTIIDCWAKACNMQTLYHEYFWNEKKINEQEENQSDRNEDKKRSHTGLNYQMKYLPASCSVLMLDLWAHPHLNI